MKNRMQEQLNKDDSRMSREKIIYIKKNFFQFYWTQVRRTQNMYNICIDKNPKKGHKIYFLSPLSKLF